MGYPVNNYLLKVNNKSTRKRCEICLNLKYNTNARTTSLMSFWCFYRLSLCPLFFTIFKRQMYFFLSSNKVHWKEIYLTVVFFLPTVSWTFILSWATMHYPPPWNFLFRKNNYVWSRQCSWHCRLSRWIKHKEKWTEQIKCKPR